jgi:hypothetical protein
VLSNVAISAPFEPPKFPPPKDSLGPIYVDVEIGGRAFSWQMRRDTKNQTLQPFKHFWTDSELQDLTAAAKAQNLTVILREANQDSVKAGGLCPVPGSFTIFNQGGGAPVAGAQKFYATNRPAGVTTQWAQPMFYTTGFANSLTHNGLTLLFRDTLHGLGAIYGNNSGSGSGCAGQAYTTQLEAWSQWPWGGPGIGSWWQSIVWNGPTSCGANMQDNTWYSLAVHANSNQDVAYGTYRWNGSAWAVDTTWKSKNPSTPWQWPVSPAYLDTTAQGLLFWAIPSNPQWSINVADFSCGWF